VVDLLKSRGATDSGQTQEEALAKKQKKTAADAANAKKMAELAGASEEAAAAAFKEVLEAAEKAAVTTAGDDEEEEAFEDEMLKTWLAEAGFGDAEFGIFAGVRFSKAMLEAVADSGEEFASDYLKEKLPKLPEKARKAIAAKAADDADGGPLTDDELRIYGERIDGMKGGMSKSGAAKKVLQGILMVATKLNTAPNAKKVRKVFKKTSANGYC
jgi:hypothetical protein